MERDAHAYDCARYHFEGDYPEGLAPEQAYVHTGFYLGWLVDQGLMSEAFSLEGAEAIKAFRAREITGPELYRRAGGVLTDLDLSDEGNEFTQHYFNFQTGVFLDDYDELLASDHPSLYHVPDTWDNYEKIKKRIHEQWEEWCESARKFTEAKTTDFVDEVLSEGLAGEESNQD